ncbi:MAG TPA: hypothetical protein VH325_10615 [Bryobacteraceae bacterium]|jgi:hypothetical protein|nr:hypothetical protein [Bryobacteraceae bacterium]
MAAARISPISSQFRFETKRLRRAISAMSIAGEENGQTRFGMFTDLSPGQDVEIRGAGFTANTVRVRVQGADYFVLRSSLIAH